MSLLTGNPGMNPQAYYAKFHLDSFYHSVNEFIRLEVLEETIKLNMQSLWSLLDISYKYTSRIQQAQENLKTFNKYSFVDVSMT